MKRLSAGQVLLVVVSCVCESRCLYRHSNSSVSQCMEKDRQGLGDGGGGEHRAGQERGAIFKRLSPVSNSNQRDYTVLSSLFNLRLKRGLFVSLVSHCSSLCHSITSGLQGKYGSRFR